MNARTGDEAETRVRRGPDAVQALRIAGSLAACLALILILPRLFSQGDGGDAPVLQTVPADSLPYSLSDRSADTPEEPRELPELWLQARSSAAGNAGWGPDVGAPFDTVWVLNSSGGREFFSSPAMVGGSLYIGCNDGSMRSVDAGSGSVLWSFRTDCGICGEAAVDSTGVYFGGQDGVVYALDRISGNRRWSAGLGYHVFCDVGLMADTLVVTGNSMGKICALHIDTGEPVWSAELGGLVLGPAVIDSVCVFTTENGKVAVYDASGGEVWTRDHSGQASPPSANTSGIYAGFAGGVMRKFDTMTGSVIWETDLTDTEQRMLLTRPVLYGGLLLAGATNGRLYCLDSRTGEELWETEFENWLQVPPAVGDTCAYVCGDDQLLHVIDLATGAPVDSIEMGSYAGTAPLLAGERLMFGTASGELFCLQGTRREPEEILPEDVAPPDEPPPADAPPAETPETPVEQPVEEPGVVTPDQAETVMPLEHGDTGEGS